MSLNNVNVTFAFQNIQGLAELGTVSITPTAVVTNTAGQTVIGATPVTVTLGLSGTGNATIVAMDNTGLTPPAGEWAYNFTVSLQGQASYTETKIVNFSNGATQAYSGMPIAVPVTAYTTLGASGSGFASPMTTLGDLIYENATPAAARLPGDTSGTRKFLRSQASAGVAQAPAWDVLQASDIPASAAFMPWQFSVDSSTYGAKGDGLIVADVSTTSGSAVITSPKIAADASAPGKHIMIHGANGTTSGPLIATISSVNPGANQATLSVAAGAAASNCPAVYGTDDTAAINSAVSAAGTYATANSFFAQVVFGAKIYILASGPTQVGNGSTTPTFNAQIPLPYPNANGITQKLIIALTGPGDNGYCQYWESTIPNVAGAALVSMISAPSTPDATFGIRSVIGGPSSAAGFTGGYANVKVVVKGLAVWCPIYTNLYAYDFGYTSAMRVQQSSAHIFAPTGVNTGAVQPYLNTISAAAFTGSIGSGFRTPVGGNNDDITMDDVTVEGYECAFRVFDHFNAGRLAAIYSDVVMYWNAVQGQSGNAHGLFIQSISAEVYNVGLLTNGGACQVDINWDAENSNIPTWDINDGGNGLWGHFRYGDKVDNRTPNINGAAHLKVINVNLSPGLMASPPAVPAASSASTPVYRDAWVIVSGGTGVAISLDGSSTGLTSGAVRVASGKTLNLGAYTVAPTWKWWLD